MVAVPKNDIPADEEVGAICCACPPALLTLKSECEDENGSDAVDDGRGGSCRGGKIPKLLPLPPPPPVAAARSVLFAVAGAFWDSPTPPPAEDKDLAPDGFTELGATTGGVGGGGVLPPRLLGEGDCGTPSPPP